MAPSLADTWHVSRRAPRKEASQEVGENGMTLKEREKEERRGGGNEARERCKERNEGSWDFRIVQQLRLCTLLWEAGFKPCLGN